MNTPWDKKLYKHPSITTPMGVFKPIDVEILRDKPDLELKKGQIMQISLEPNGWVSLGTFGKTGSGTCYAEVADGTGRSIDVQESIDFRII